MPVYYRIYQKQKGTNAGKWYARVAYTESMDEIELAEAIEEKCTVNKADVVAVIQALITEISRALQSSKRVTLNRFGTFKMGMSAKPADKREDFTAQKNIRDLHVVFQPYKKKDSSTKTYTRAFISGATVKELSPYNNGSAETSTSDSGTSSGGDQQGSGTGTGGGDQQGSGSSSGSSTGGGDQQG